MAGRIRQEDIQAVRERTDIVKVIGGHLQLKKAGSDRLVGLCPFHAEKTPSLSVSPSKQLYYCFGCGEGGNVFRFLKQIESLSFGEVVERLAAEAGVTLRYEGQTGADRMAVGRRQSLHRAVGEAARLYHRTLTDGREGSEARSYLSSRGISRDSVDGFGIGYAPGYPDFLLRRLSKGFSPELLVEAGVVAKDSSGALRDRFRGRVVFPIHDLSGNAVGFGGRLLEGPKAPQNAAKYVNSPETPIYHKGTLLYNLNRAKPEITRSGRAFLVEGYTDVIALHQAGIPTAVATCGTALGEEHIRLLSRFAERAVLAFDSDEAGARAAERAYQFHERYPVELLVLVLPRGQDPADFVQSSGGEAFEGLAARAVPLVEYMIRRTVRVFDVADTEGKARAIRAALPVVAKLEEEVRRNDYALFLADLVGAEADDVREEVNRFRSDAGRSNEADAVKNLTRRLSPHQKVEREALKLLIQAPSLSGSKLPGLRVEHFAMPQHRTAFALLTQAAPAPDGLATLAPSDLVAMAQEHARGDQIGKLIAALAVEPAETVGAVSQEYVDQVFLRLEEFCLKREADDIRKRLQRLNPLSASDEYDELYERFVKLEGARRRIRAAAEAVGASI